MKQLLFTCIGLVLQTFIFSQISDNYFSPFLKDSSYYVLNNESHIRLNPDSTGKILFTVPIGEKIRIIEDTGFPYTRHGYTTNWYRIMFLAKGLKEEGYIWGGDISTKTITSIGDKQVSFMYGVEKLVEGENFPTITATVKVCKEKKELASIWIPAVGKLNTYNEAMSLGARGVTGLIDIFKISFSDGFCAGAFGDAYIFWDGTHLFHATTLDKGFDAPYFSTNDLIFPTDEKGSKKGYIIGIEKTGYSNDNNKEILEQYRIVTYQWNGNQLLKIKVQKKK